MDRHWAKIIANFLEVFTEEKMFKLKKFAERQWWKDAYRRTSAKKQEVSILWGMIQILLSR